MLYHLTLLFSFGACAWSLQCQTASPPNCNYNKTCKYDIKECHSSDFSSNIRGGVYCITIVNNDPNEIIIGKMDCMYDQETSKTCKNQTQCIMNYTNKDKQYLHCCCDKDFCNYNFIRRSLPDVTTNPPESPIDPCKDLLCKRFNIILICLIIGFVLILILICCFYWKKLLKSGKKITSFIGKEKQIETTRPLLDPIEVNHDYINFNKLIFANPIKQGRYSIIYQGKFNNEDVAIKGILNKNDLNYSKLFEIEKQIYSLPFMEHENILKYYGYSINNNYYYIITELSQYGSLRDVLRSRLLQDEYELILICKQICSGLEYLHKDFRNEKQIEKFRPPIAHRDFKSDNILYLHDNKLVICDFAMSIKLDQNQNCPNEQQQIGTARYMSPEVLAGTIGCETHALLKCDVYALGIVLWEVLSRFPFEQQDYNEPYEMPFEYQLNEHKLNLINPQINDMFQIVNLDKPMNRPLIKSSWRRTTKKSINEIILTMEQCWDQNPEGRITAALAASRMNQLL